MPDGVRAPTELTATEFLEAATELFAVLSPEGRCLQTNRAWERVVGYRPDQAPDPSLWAHVVPDDRSGVRERFA